MTTDQQAPTADVREATKTITATDLTDALTRYFIAQNMGQPGPRQERMAADVWFRLTDRGLVLANADGPDDETMTRLLAAAHDEGRATERMLANADDPVRVAADALADAVLSWQSGQVVEGLAHEYRRAALAASGTDR